MKKIKVGIFFPNIMLNNILFKIFELVRVFPVGFVSTQTQSNFFKVNVGVIYTTFHIKNHNYNPIFFFASYNIGLIDCIKFC